MRSPPRREHPRRLLSRRTTWRDSTSVRSSSSLASASPAIGRVGNAPAEAGPQETRTTSGAGSPTPRTPPSTSSATASWPAPTRSECAALLEVLTLVKSPRTAGPMLELMLGVEGSRGRPTAGSTSIPATPSPASSPWRRGRASWPTPPWTTSAPRSGKGHEGFIRECLAAGPPESPRRSGARCWSAPRRPSRALDDETTPDWLRAACDGAKTLKPPGWVAAGRPAADPRRWAQAECRASEGRAGGPGQEHARMRPIRSSPPSRRTPIADRSTPSPGPCSSAGSLEGAHVQGEVGHGRARPARLRRHRRSS